MNRLDAHLGGCLVLLSFFTACGSSDKGTPKSPDAGGGNTASTGGATSASGGATSSSSGGVTASSGGTTAASGGATSLGCNLSPCTGKTAFGTPLTACCQSATLCGVTVAAVGQCFDPAQIPSADSGAFSPERIVSDPKCKGTTFPTPDGGAPIHLGGCCDKSDVCGFSTANVPSVGGFSLPTQCITPTEVRQFGGGIDAGAAVHCDYPADGG